MELEHHAHRSLITLRSKIPGIACKLYKPELSSEYAFKYEIPKSFDDLESWARRVVVFRESNPSAFEEHNSIKKDNLWRASDEHYTLELQISSSCSERGWTFSMLSLHSNIDGRSSAIFMDHFFKYLQSSIDGSLSDPRCIIWGDEVARLPLLGPFAPHISSSGQPPSVPDPATLMPPPKPEGFSPWIVFPFVSKDGRGDACRRVKFTKETTSKLHSISKSHGRTITQTLTALLSLAFTESLLFCAAEKYGDNSNSVYESFMKSTHYLIPMNFIDKRARLPEGFNTFDTGKPTPHFATDSFDIAFPMEPIRRLFNVDRSTKSISHTIDREVFWDKLVESVANAWNNVDKSKEAYLMRQFGLHTLSLIEPFDTSVFGTVSMTISSFGDFGRMGILRDFRPEAGNKVLTVDDVMSSMHSSLPILSSYVYEYDGQLQVFFVSGDRYTHDSMMGELSESLQGWVDELF